MKETSLKGYILHDSNYITFWNRQNYGERKKSVFARGYRGTTNKWKYQKEKTLWMHNINQDRVVQEAGLTETTLPHKKVGRLWLMWKCTPAGTTAVSGKL